MDKSCLKQTVSTNKLVNNNTSKDYDVSHTQQTMRDAKQRDSEKRAKGIAKQKEIFKARMIKAIGVVLTVVFYLIFVL